MKKKGKKDEAKGPKKGKGRFREDSVRLGATRLGGALFFEREDRRYLRPLFPATIYVRSVESCLESCQGASFQFAFAKIEK